MPEIICTCDHSINDHSAHRFTPSGALFGRCEKCLCRLTPEEVAEAEYQRRELERAQEAFKEMKS
jgi:hypothetical protein